ncbi:MAG TPA: exodeoxyribonuclease V subunit alpha [Dyella sp.]|uniref:exodeoxyribonuclease V subunit alpha n=1 Tax=Dyella sp. TaxID=1869338 RepID=UPI002C695F3E|nr:exodeoxyribonuclease V subunit alpha [Dyella sp.]HTV84372.1 exodeoxyribonuclease V subunit alpha [Dyella sp.]
MPLEALPSLLADEAARRTLRPLDLAFARFIGECDPHAEPCLLLIAALASRQLDDGHPCLDLQAAADLALEQLWPATWLEMLAGVPSLSSPLLAGPDGQPANAPLVLDRHRVYLRRYWEYECRVARGIAARLQHAVPSPERLRDELARLFSDAPQTSPDWQRVACALAARGGFSLITGGPGTGKTTTVVRLLGLLQTLQLREQDTPLRMRLAAPTGKAAARLNASIAAQVARLDVGERVRAAIPRDVETLHRLLGARTDSRRYAHDGRHPLHVDVLVIDEASMIDLEMMAAVLDALPPHARLILLGDKDQLSSVEAGAVLGELGQRAEQGHYDAPTAAWLHAVGTGSVDAFVHADARPLDQHIAMLRSSHRFGADSGIGRLAAAVNAGEVTAVRDVLGAQAGDIAWIADGANSPFLASIALNGDAGRFGIEAAQGEPHGFRFYLGQLQQHRPAASADSITFRRWANNVLGAFNHFQVLCAVRQGPAGTERLNRDIAATLLATGLIESDRGWYEGRPVMMTRNDYSLGLMNGDVGVTLRMPGPDGELRLYVAFPMTRDGAVAEADHEGVGIRCILPSRLGDVETVYAMTVHKSQGSEFEHVALVLPDEGSAILTRELLYTGITRARRWLSLFAGQASVEQAIGQRTRRYSGLSDRLAPV